MRTMMKIGICGCPLAGLALSKRLSLVVRICTVEYRARLEYTLMIQVTDGGRTSDFNKDTAMTIEKEKMQPWAKGQCNGEYLEQVAENQSIKQLDMSTAWYKSRVVPTLLQTWQHRNRSVEVWKTTCIVTNFGKPTAAVTSSVEVPVCKVEAAHVQVLINPANPELSGVSKFPYFPRGGPTPKQLPNKDAHHIMGYVSTCGVVLLISISVFFRIYIIHVMPIR